MKKGFVAAPQLPPTTPVPVELTDIHAIKALHRGEATPDQQVRFVAWFNRATAVMENPYRHDSTHDTAFACGKRFVADQYHSVVKLILNNPGERE